MAPFLFFLLQSSLIFNTAFVKCSDIFDSFYYFGDDESTDMVKPTKLPPIIPPSNLDLNSLSLDTSSEKKFNRKRKMVNDSPISPAGFISSRNNSPSSMNINEYSKPSQVLTAEDDYFFLDLDYSDYKLGDSPSYQIKYPEPNEIKSKSGPKLNEELILVGSEFVPKNQVNSIKRSVKDDSEEYESTRERANSGLYEMIVNNLLFAVSTLSPKSVRQMFEPKAEASVQINNEKKLVNPVKSVKVTSVINQTIRKESSNDFSDMIKRYYKSYLDLEKAEHLVEEYLF